MKKRPKPQQVDDAKAIIGLSASNFRQSNMCVCILFTLFFTPKKTKTEYKMHSLLSTLNYQPMKTNTQQMIHDWLPQKMLFSSPTKEKKKENNCTVKGFIDTCSRA